MKKLIIAISEENAKEVIADFVQQFPMVSADGWDITVVDSEHLKRVEYFSHPERRDVLLDLMPDKFETTSTVSLIAGETHYLVWRHKYGPSGLLFNYKKEDQ